MLERCALTPSRAIEIVLEQWDAFHKGACTHYDVIIDDIIERADTINERGGFQYDIDFIEDAADSLVQLLASIHAYLWHQLHPLPLQWIERALEHSEWVFVQVVDIMERFDTVHIRVTTQN